MKRVLRRVVAPLLSPAVRDLIRRMTGAHRRQLEARNRRTVAELEAVMRATLFPSLPDRHGRAELLARLIGTGPAEAMYLVESVHRSLGVEGAVCEFGVAQGATSALLANEIMETGRELWLFDSFKGLPAPTEKDVLIDDIFSLGSIKRYAGTMAYGQAEVRKRLTEVGFPSERLHVVAGPIEETVTRVELPSKICFAFIDFDFYQPIATALDVVVRRMPTGGQIVVDDYGHFSAGAQAAVDEFVASHPQYQVFQPPEFAGRFVVLQQIRS